MVRRTFVMYMTGKLVPANLPTVTLAKHIPQEVPLIMGSYLLLSSKAN